MIDLNKPGELVIKQRYSPRIKLLLAVILTLALLASAGFIYNYGLNRAGFERQSAQQTEQTLQDESVIQGRAILEISGMQVGEDTLLRFPATNERPIMVNFKYFQDIEGKLELPRNFQPKRIKVYITTSGGTSMAEATYAWPLG